MVVVGADPVTQRTWYLSKALLIRHCTHLAEICTNPFLTSVTLEDVDIRAFTNFVDYMRSSIYTLNEQIPGYRRVHEGIKACLIGQKLGCMAYSNAAIISLHMGFEPLAQLKTSNKRLSTIRAEDIDFVCRNTNKDENNNDLCKGLRQLFHDAVASHWSNWEVNKLTGHHDEYMGDWTELCVNYDDFRVTLLASCRTSDAQRHALFKPVNQYLSVEKRKVDEEATVKVDSPGCIPRRHRRSQACSDSEACSFWERAEAGIVNTGATQNGDEDALGREETGEVRARDGNGWTMVNGATKKKA
ncbi:hypothetical protein SNOG_08416 [Parastagonospora nodorum SN15]|uniref:BTB domain-containing protein n=1 Tax=Phaeosphaeria nodorum (strain SN15 / ATCC MYA-4574 / FGSC 10173) TaxID=321614 RepID=Q0UIJ8_PHANO|nr:hypothetical protein SNOG_08416 [Parastagonospora nodorum SN15]EAT84692.2 hypothetical protein SNOG_08416 [Parastagonospora nodorum SN15]